MEPPRSSPPDSEARPSPLPPASARWLVCGGRRRASSRAGMPPGGKLQGAGGPLAPPRGREETRRFPRGASRTHRGTRRYTNTEQPHLPSSWVLEAN